MKRVYVCTILVLIASLAAFAQSAASDTPATREDVLKLFDVMNLREQMHLVMDSMMKQQRQMIHESLRKRSPQITEQELARMDQFTSDILKDLPIDGMLDDMIPVYQRHLSKADIEAMSTFYASPTGQKMLREMPAMTSESMQAAAPRVQAMMDKVMDRAEQMAREERAKRNGTAKPETRKN